MLGVGLCLSAAASPFARVNRFDAKNFPPDWRNAVEITGLVRPVTLDCPQERTSLRLLHDGIFLYGEVQCVQRGAEKLSGSLTRDDIMLWKDNGIELFFCQTHEKIVHVIINTDGTVADMIREHGQDAYSWNGTRILGKKKSPDGWSAVFRIPLAELPFDSNGKIFFNLVRNNNTAHEASSWSPLARHLWIQPEKFGTIVLAGPSEASCGVTFRNLPVFKTRGVLSLSFLSLQPETVKINLKADEKTNARTSALSAGSVTEEDMVYFMSGGSRTLEMTVHAGSTLLVSSVYAPTGDFINVFAEKNYSLSTVREMPTLIYWNSIHSFPVKNDNGSRIDADYEICFDLPDGVSVEGMVRTGVSPRGKNRFLASVRQDKAYSAPDWVRSALCSTLPDGSEGEIFYRVKWKDYLQKEEKFTFKVCAFKQAEPPKELVTYLYGCCPEKAEDGELLRKYGINTFMYPGWNAALVKDLMKRGFFVIRGGYFFPGGYKGFISWPKYDRAARALDINGNTVIGSEGTPQFSPSYRGKYFTEGVQREKAFAEATGIRHYAFDLEGYIMPNAAIACFRPETVARFKKWFAEKYPETEYISPLVFEKEQGKYPEYHLRWIMFKDYIFADFFREFRKRMGDPRDSRSVPWKGLTFSEWSYGIPESPEDINRNMRGPEFLKAVTWFEEDSYSGADRGIREMLYRREQLQKRYPDITLKLIFCPSPERLDAGRPHGYYYSAAPVLDEELKYKIFDAVSLGAYGIGIWKNSLMTARAWKSFTESLKAIRPVEKLIRDGKFMTDLKCDQPLGLLKEVRLFKRTVLKNQPKVLVKGIRCGGECLISVSEYTDLSPVTVTVVCPVKRAATVTDLESGEKVADISPETGTSKVRLDKCRCRLLHIVEKP